MLQSFFMVQNSAWGGGKLANIVHCHAQHFIEPPDGAIEPKDVIRKEQENIKCCALTFQQLNFYRKKPSAQTQ